jgi:hypothetical protein
MSEYENNFVFFKKKVLVMETINNSFKKSKLSKTCSLSEVSLTDFRGYQGVLKCNNSDRYIKIILGFSNFLNKFNRSQVIFKKSKERKEKPELIIFNEFKKDNSVLVRVENYEEEI